MRRKIGPKTRAKIGAAIKTRRLGLGWPMSLLAKVAGVNYAGLWRIESGLRAPRPLTAAALNRAFDLPDHVAGDLANRGEDPVLFDLVAVMGLSKKEAGQIVWAARHGTKRGDAI